MSSISNDVILEAVVDLTAAVGARFDRVDGRLDRVDYRLGAVETRLGAVETRLGNVENRVEGLEGQMGELTTVLRSVDRRLSVVEAR
jgi:archaellum component FlaC